MKYLFILLISALPVFVFAQDQEEEGHWQEASAASEAYHTFRLKNSTPPYGLAKVKSLIKKINTRTEDNSDYYDSPMSRKIYLSLSLREKFTYHMIYPESYSQNCDVSAPIIDEEKKILGNLPDVFSESNWSRKQLDFMVSNRDSVLSLIKESVNRSKRMGLNYKTAIVEVNGREMIPFLIDFYLTDRKDNDILTVLTLLLKKNEYKPFMTSASFIKLYGKKSNYQSFINLNKDNVELIISRAKSYYDGIR